MNGNSIGDASFGQECPRADEVARRLQQVVIEVRRTSAPERINARRKVELLR